MNTNCSSCKAEMPELSKSVGNSPIERMPMKITGYRCQFCGHFNDLKRRKAFQVVESSETKTDTA